MAVSVPTQFQLLQGRDVQIERARPIRGATLRRLALNATWVYASACRRRALHHDPPQAIETTSASYETLFEVPFTFSSRRERVALRISTRTATMDLRVEVYDPTVTTPHSTYTFANAGAAADASADITAPGAGNDEVVLVVSVRRNTGATGYLYALRIEESPLDVAALP